MDKVIINIIILVLIIIFQLFINKRKFIKCRENPTQIIQNVIEQLLISKNDSQISINGEKNEYITLRKKENGIFLYWISSTTNDDDLKNELLFFKKFVEEKGFLYIFHN